MADNTAIEWTDATWNPIRARYTEFAADGSYTDRIGWHCTHVSEGCRYCYAESFNRRLGTGLDYKPTSLAEPRKPGQIGTNPGATIFLDEATLTQPLRWKKPRKIFVCSMTDFFADFVTDEMRDRIFAVMALCPQHTFQILTKRAGWMSNYMNDESPLIRLHHEAAEDISGTISGFFSPWCNIYSLYLQVSWPLPNVWLGTSIENQDTANERLPLLLSSPAARHFISAEPLLGPIDISAVQPHIHGRGISVVQPLDWVIVGGESGQNARPMHPDWVRDIRDRCALAGAAFFFKQWGEWRPCKVFAGGDLLGEIRSGRVQIVHPTSETTMEVFDRTGINTIPGSKYMERVGKKAAGAILDGRHHREFPERKST